MSEDAFCLQVAIDGRSDGVKNFSRMLGCLDRFGKELFFEFNNDEVRASSRLPHLLITASYAGNAEDDQHGAISIRPLHPGRGLFPRLAPAARAVGFYQAAPEEHGLDLQVALRGGNGVAAACCG